MNSMLKPEFIEELEVDTEDGPVLIPKTRVVYSATHINEQMCDNPPRIALRGISATAFKDWCAAGERLGHALSPSKLITPTIVRGANVFIFSQAKQVAVEALGHAISSIFYGVKIAKTFKRAAHGSDMGDRIKKDYDFFYNSPVSDSFFRMVNDYSQMRLDERNVFFFKPDEFEKPYGADRALPYYTNHDGKGFINYACDTSYVPADLNVMTVCSRKAIERLLEELPDLRGSVFVTGDAGTKFNSCCATYLDKGLSPKGYMASYAPLYNALVKSRTEPVYVNGGLAFLPAGYETVTEARPNANNNAMIPAEWIP